jgi:Putative zincin peptidase
MTMTPAPAPVPPPEGYKDVSIPLEKIATSGFVLSMGLLAVPIGIYWLTYGVGAFFDNLLSGINLIVLIVLIILSVVVHELIHAISWKVFGNLRWSDLSFGVDRKTLSPYCHAKAPMEAGAYKIGALLPGLLTGVIPSIIGIAIQNPTVTFFGAFLLSAAVGDVIVVWVLRRVPPNALVMDHPSQAGCYVKMP